MSDLVEKVARALNNHVVRTHVGEGVDLTNCAKAAIAVVLCNLQRWMDDNNYTFCRCGLRRGYIRYWQECP